MTTSRSSHPVGRRRSTEQGVMAGLSGLSALVFVIAAIVVLASGDARHAVGLALLAVSVVLFGLATYLGPPIAELAQRARTDNDQRSIDRQLDGREPRRTEDARRVRVRAEKRVSLTRTRPFSLAGVVALAGGGLVLLPLTSVGTALRIVIGLGVVVIAVATVVEAHGVRRAKAYLAEQPDQRG